jgi:hypothetical protein
VTAPNLTAPTLPPRLEHLRFRVPGMSDLTMSREDMQALLVALRFGYAWSMEEAFGLQPSVRKHYCTKRSERIRSLIVRIEEALGLPAGERMLQDLDEPKRRHGVAPRGADHWKVKQCEERRQLQSQPA